MKQTQTMWCEKCKKETLHKEIGWGDYQGIMHQWFSCENNCYNEKVIAIGTQIHKGVFIQARRPTPRALDAARRCTACKALLEDRSVYCDVCGTDTPRQ